MIPKDLWKLPNFKTDLTKTSWINKLLYILYWYTSPIIQTDKKWPLWPIPELRVRVTTGPRAAQIFRKSFDFHGGNVGQLDIQNRWTIIEGSTNTQPMNLSSHTTLPETKSLPRKIDGWKINILFSGSVSTSTSSSSLAASKWPWLPLVQLRKVHPWKNLKITCFSKETSSFHPPSFFGVPNVNLQGVVGYLVTIDGNDSKPRFCQVFRRMMTRLRVEKKKVSVVNIRHWWQTFIKWAFVHCDKWTYPGKKSTEKLELRRVNLDYD